MNEQREMKDERRKIRDWKETQLKRKSISKKFAVGDPIVSDGGEDKIELQCELEDEENNSHSSPHRISSSRSKQKIPKRKRKRKENKEKQNIDSSVGLFSLFSSFFLFEKKNLSLFLSIELNDGECDGVWCPFPFRITDLIPPSPSPSADRLPLVRFVFQSSISTARCHSQPDTNVRLPTSIYLFSLSNYHKNRIETNERKVCRESTKIHQRTTRRENVRIRMQTEKDKFVLREIENQIENLLKKGEANLLENRSDTKRVFRETFGEVFSFDEISR